MLIEAKIPRGRARCRTNTLIDFYFGGEYAQLINLFSPTGRQLAHEEEEEEGGGGTPGSSLQLPGLIRVHVRPRLAPSPPARRAATTSEAGGGEGKAGGGAVWLRW